MDALDIDIAEQDYDSAKNAIALIGDAEAAVSRVLYEEELDRQTVDELRTAKLALYRAYKRQNEHLQSAADVLMI